MRLTSPTSPSAPLVTRHELKGTKEIGAWDSH